VVAAATSREIALATYRVIVAPGMLARAADMVRLTAQAHRYAIITDGNVGPLYAQKLRTALDESRTLVYTIQAGEAFKTRETWALVTDALLDAGFGRDTSIIALGGGVVGDLAGFVAATFMRGVPVVQIPTTLLAMIDASVGGKTGVDTVAGKNLVGAFHPPAAVIADTNVLSSLPIEHLRAGMAEAIKHGVIADAEYFERVRDVAGRIGKETIPEGEMLDLVARSVEIKASVVVSDEREAGVRKTLNFGHTIGHAVELASGYSLLHGEAVAIGMVYESALAERLGIAEAGTAARVREAVQVAGLPDKRPASVTVDAILEAARGDKKARAGRVEYALPASVGSMTAASRGWAIPVSDAAVREILA
jgi:3-dehydroquinate synthase